MVVWMAVAVKPTIIIVLQMQLHRLEAGHYGEKWQRQPVIMLAWLSGWQSL
jgi:hypothetical protein